MKSASVVFILIVVMKKPKLIFVLLGLMLMTVIGLGSFGASAMAAKTDHFGVSHTASAPQAAGAGADYLYAGDHHGASHDRRSLPGHHEGRHGGASGAAGGSTCCEMACSPMMFSDTQFGLSVPVFSGRYCFSNTPIAVSTFGDPPLRPPRRAV
ncbi:hypothetical protein [Ferrovibrio xuzhouensis]|uniref:DUF2946 domain-containing protein n=1 Tax=Ferrovibrio xuzhouensis TaxID=1576914 RepID=A0ABV7VCR9_9PROT